MRISFVWWNTSLSPGGRNRATEEQRLWVCEAVDFILNECDVDFIALGEVTDKDISALNDSCRLDGFRIHNGFVKAGRSYFDTCFIYKLEKMELLGEDINITSNKGGRTLKIAQRADFMIPGNEHPVHIFISHWPSLLWCHENSADRHSLGMRLRDAVENISVDLGKLADVILMGDYNDEPFDASLAEQLMATRDRDLARTKLHLLYNPFWRRMTSASFYSQGHEEQGGCGTYFRESGNITRWRTFDQIIFSPTFLERGPWHLNESLTGILEMPGCFEMVVDANQIFDHLPVIGVIEKED